MLYTVIRLFATNFAKDAGYVVQVKDNCAALKKIVATQEKELPIDTYTEEEKKSHGRTETRKIAVFKASTELPKKWQALVKYFIVITRSGTRNNKP
ncbi:MAG: hypothetical protein IPL33_12460 [Sphingobacteriales bacterium]|nr:hypothetical protein [Sphingobacteriales bacterium]